MNKFAPSYYVAVNRKAEFIFTDWIMKMIEAYEGDFGAQCNAIKIQTKLNVINCNSAES